MGGPDRLFTPEKREISVVKATKLEPHGMCGGVVASVNFMNVLFNKVAGREPVFGFNPVVHNHTINKRHQDQGLVIINERTTDGDWPIHLVPDNSLVMLPAHGHKESDVAQLEAKGCIVFQTVCALVVNEWREVEEAAKEGKMTLLYGRPGHPEPRGTLSHAPENLIRLISKPQDIDEYVESPDFNPAQEHELVNQTTQSVKDIKEGKQRALDLIPLVDTNVKRGGCYATDNRQLAAEIALTKEEADALLVVGSGDISNNTRNLAKVAWDLGKPGWIINNAKEMDWTWFKLGSGIEHLALSSGASCDESEFEGVAESLEKKGVEIYLQESSIKERKTEFPIPAYDKLPLLEERYRNWPAPLGQ